MDISPKEKAKELISLLGFEGCFYQCADEWANCDSDEDRKFWVDVKDEINKFNTK